MCHRGKTESSNEIRSHFPVTVITFLCMALIWGFWIKTVKLVLGLHPNLTNFAAEVGQSVFPIALVVICPELQLRALPTCHNY